MSREMSEQWQLDLIKKEYWRFSMFEDLLKKSLSHLGIFYCLQKKLLIFFPLKIQIRAKFRLISGSSLNFTYFLNFSF